MGECTPGLERLHLRGGRTPGGPNAPEGVLREEPPAAH